MRNASFARCLNITVKSALRQNSVRCFMRSNVATNATSRGRQGNLLMGLCRVRTIDAGISRCYSQEVATEEVEEYHSIIKDTERAKGAAEKLEFQAETRKLLDIVAKSLYSEKEVFIRELISNSSDALEKFRYITMRGESVRDGEIPLEIHIAADDNKKTLTIQDTGLGMTKQEIIDNLGIIARSGSKNFLEQLDNNASGSVDKNIIGQFGVGFYSAFMVADRVDVYTQSYKSDSPGYKWTSDGLGSYELSEAENVQRGTKVVIHLKGDSQQFSKDETLKEVIKKYSNFVGVPIFVNGKKVNVVQVSYQF